MPLRTAAWLSQTNEITRTFLAASRIPGMINLGVGLPEPDTFPAAELSGLAAKAVAQHPGDALAYPPIEGLPELRDLIAERFSTADLQLTRANVLILSGGMQGLDLVGKVFLDPGSEIAAQSPAYLGALDAWRPRGPVYRTMLLDEERPTASTLSGARFAYAVPNFSNPTGKMVDLPTREALVDAAHATEVPVVEDDPYGALFYDGDPLPRLIEMSAARGRPGPYAGPVIYMGSLSKVLAPGLRVGWAIANEEIIEALTVARQGSDIAGAGLSQRIAIDALQGGVVERNLPKILSIYRARRDALCDALQTHLGDSFDWEVPVGGMFVWITAKDAGFDSDAFLAEAMDAGVCISPSSVFDPAGEDRRSMRLNFTANAPERLVEGVRRLAAALDRARAAA